MKSGWLGLAIERGATFRLRLAWLDSARAPVNLTGCTARLAIWHVATDATPIVNLTATLNAALGTLDFEMGVAAIALITAKGGVHAVEVTHPDGSVTRLVDGPVDLLLPGARPPRRAVGAYLRQGSGGAAGESSVVVVSESEVQVVSVGLQGPPGTAHVAYPAGEAVGGHRIVVIMNGAAYHADPSNLAHAGLVVGMTKGAAAQGAAVEIISHGELAEPTWSLTPNTPIYLGANGVPSNAAPSSGFVQEIGFSLNATTIFIQLGKPLIKA